MWTLEQVKRLQKYVDGKRKFIVLHNDEQVGFIDIPPDELYDKYGAEFHYGTESDPDAYDPGNGESFNDTNPEDFQVIEKGNSKPFSEMP